MRQLLAGLLLLAFVPGCEDHPRTATITMNIDLPQIVWKADKPAIPGVHMGVHIGSACWCVPKSEWDTLIKLRPAAKDCWKMEYMATSEESAVFGPVWVLATKLPDGKLDKRLPWLKNDEEEKKPRIKSNADVKIDF
jgi:hypothetical protein